MHFTPWPFWLRIVSIGDGGLAGLAVADDQLALAAADRGHGVDGLDPGLQRLVHGLAARRCPAPGPRAGGSRWSAIGALAVDRLAERVHDPAEQRVADRHRQDAPGRPDRAAPPRWRVDLPRTTAPIGLLVEVEGEAERAVLELEQLVDRGHGQPGDPGDAVADLGDAAHLLGGDLGRVVGDVSLQRGGDLVGVDGQLCHRVSLGSSLPRRPHRLRRCSSCRSSSRAARWRRRAGRRSGSRTAEKVGSCGDLQLHGLAGERVQRAPARVRARRRRSGAP